MKSALERLALRRAALVDRSSAQRAELAANLTRLKRDAAMPVLLSAGVAATLLGSSPQLRSWAIRAWGTYALVRRLLRP